MKLSRLIVIIMALLPFALFGNKRTQIDFNYPQTVSEDALKDLNSALKSGNGQMVVDALIRYSIAQSGRIIKTLFS